MMNESGEIVDIGPFAKINKDGREYEVRFVFNWETMQLIIACRVEPGDENSSTKQPIGAQIATSFDMLFGIKEDMVKFEIEAGIENLAKMIKKNEEEQ